METPKSLATPSPETAGSPAMDSHAVVPLASRGPISRKTFTQWLEQAAAVATPESAPVLLVIALDGLDDRHDDTLLDAAAWQLCEALGDEGLVCRLDGARLGVMVANDGWTTPDAIGVALLGALARPFDGFSGKLPHGARLGMAHWGKQGTSAEALFVAAGYALQESHAAAVAEAEAEAESPFEELTEKLAVNQS